ncbi:MAG TPA: sigma-70 family RNA polymerase sigma factor [Patescibacteria group bacterium]|nr:sigma-70 family RNA polymerase sigma factor [Patescibacteria group bacterium]
MATAAIPEEMLVSGMRLVAQIARTFRARGLEQEELVAAGRLGLMRAFLRYDPARGTRFSTCALPWIRKEMIGTLARHRRMVHVPSYAVTRMSVVRRTQQALTAALGRPPSRDETSRALARPVRDVEKILMTEIHVLPLEEPAGERDGLALLDRLADPRATTPEEELARAQTVRAIRRALARLTPRERQVLEGRYGLDDDETRTLEEMGREIGLSREAVRLIERRAIRRLRYLLAGPDSRRPARETSPFGHRAFTAPTP